MVAINHQDVVSNMGSSGIPGASLFAFSKAYPEAKIIGCDIDKRILFNKDNIETYFLDQNDYSSYSVLNDYRKKIDFFIDDGLHCQSANLNSLKFALENISEDGVIFIEDIPEYALSTWVVVNRVLPSNFEIKLIKTKSVYCAVVSRI